MIVNFQELDKRIDKILNTVFKCGFSYELFSNRRINIVDNNVSFAEKRNIGMITMLGSGEITVRIYGYHKRVTLKKMMHGNMIVFKPKASLVEVGMRTRRLLKKYTELNKKL